MSTLSHGEHPKGWLGTKAFFAKTDQMLRLAMQNEKITFLIESTYTKVAEKINFIYKPEPKRFWIDYVEGRI